MAPLASVGGCPSFRVLQFLSQQYSRFGSFFFLVLVDSLDSRLSSEMGGCLAAKRNNSNGCQITEPHNCTKTPTSLST